MLLIRIEFLETGKALRKPSNRYQLIRSWSQSQKTRQKFGQAKNRKKTTGLKINATNFSWEQINLNQLTSDKIALERQADNLIQWL